MSKAARPRAVLFDLYNTLVPGGTHEERDDVSHAMADILGVDSEDLAALVRRTFDDRTRGRLGDLRQTVKWLAGQLGAEPTGDAVDAAVELRLAMTRQLHQGTWGLGTLTALRRAGLLIGLVSDCSAETPAIWPQSPIASLTHAVSFSCITGHRKPEPEAYLSVVRDLGVEPHECVFVGDGGSFELSGASGLGMATYRFRAECTDPGDAIDQDEAWAGPTISDLTELVVAASP